MQETGQISCETEKPYLLLKTNFLAEKHLKTPFIFSLSYFSLPVARKHVFERLKTCNAPRAAKKLCTFFRAHARIIF